MNLTLFARFERKNVMKRVISLILLLALFLSVSYCAFADGKEFDYESILGNRNGFRYDRFDKSWTYFGAYAEYYEDATVIIGFQAESYSGESGPAFPMLFVRILDIKGNKLDDVESIDILVGEDIYSYESMQVMEKGSAVVIADDGMLLLNAINNSHSSDAAFRLGVKGKGYLTIDNLDHSEYSDLREFCRVFLKYNIWDYCTDKDTANLSESRYPLTINGEPVPHKG